MKMRGVVACGLRMTTTIQVVRCRVLFEESRTTWRLRLLESSIEIEGQPEKRRKTGRAEDGARCSCRREVACPAGTTGVPSIPGGLKPKGAETEIESARRE